MTWQPDLETLELFLAVVDEGSIGAGARRMGIRQPNASRVLRQLETSLGLVLLTRTSQGSRPTPEGRLLAEWAQPVVEQTDVLRRAVDSLTTLDSGPVAVASSMTIAEQLVPGWLARLRTLAEERPVRLLVQNSVGVADTVRAGRADVGFIEDDSLLNGLTGRVVAHDRLLLVVAPGHPWSRREDPVGAAELAQTHLVLREEGSGTRSTLEHALAPIVLAEPALVGNSNAMVRTAARAGVAPAVLSELVVADDVRDGDLLVVPFTGVDLSRLLRAVWRVGQRPRGTAGRLVLVAGERVRRS